MENNEKSFKSKISAFLEKHAETWKFIKFMVAGGASSVIELIVHMILLETVFKSLKAVPITNEILNMINIDSKGYLYTYLISTAVGYTIAFILNRKVTFKADSNPTLSIILYIIMVVGTIFANGWIGSALSSFAVQNGFDTFFGELVIKIVCMAIPTLWTYPLNRFVIHRKKKEK